MSLTAIIKDGKISSQSAYTWYKNGSEYSSCSGSVTCVAKESGTYRVEALTTSGARIKSSDYVVQKINVAVNNPVGSNEATPPVRLSALNNLKNFYSSVVYTWYKNGSVYSKCTGYQCDVTESGRYTFTVGISGFTSDRASEETVNIKSSSQQPTYKAPTITITSTVNGKKVDPSVNCAKGRLEITVKAVGDGVEVPYLAFQYLYDNKWYNDPTGAWKSLTSNGNTTTATIYFDYAIDSYTGYAVKVGYIPFKVKASDKRGEQTIVDYPIWMCVQ